jgi:hypothetical protein
MRGLKVRQGGDGWRGARALVLLAAVGGALAQPKPTPSGIYTCIDDKGKRITSDRPIAECTGKEQRVLNKDGSLKAVYPPTLTADERAEKEAKERKDAEARAAQADAVRRDRNLKARYPNEESHAKAREAALDSVRLAVKNSELRLKDLAAERKPLLDEAEFYVGKTLPPKLRQALDANDASTDAQRSSLVSLQAEMVRINRFYDHELDRLRRLWAGAQPGTLGPLDNTAAVPASAAR